VGAEAGVTASTLAGSTENIRPAVALQCEGLSLIRQVLLFWDSFAAIFFVFLVGFIRKGEILSLFILSIF
jgi:hypothetical protein